VVVCQILWDIDGVRTTLDLDDDLLAALIARQPGVSKTEAIQRAVRFYLIHDAATQLRDLAGILGSGRCVGAVAPRRSNALTVLADTSV
jgi:hypothetical protein